jgi:ribosomal protein L25 (general stress protein Ctc)
MKKKIFSALVFISIAFFSSAQNLQSFTATLQTKENGSNYLSIINKKACSLAEATVDKSAIDLALILTKDNGKQKMEWYNMSGKDSKIPAEVIGTSTLINAISFDRDQFDKCKTNQDLKRMVGHITNNSFSHFASIGDNIEKEIAYHCFIIQLQNGKRALLWIDIDGKKAFKVFVKVQA